MLKNTHNVLQMAFVILLMLSFNVLAQDKNASKLDCKPLPQDKRFKALGYELGTCKSEVENLLEENLDSNINTTSKFNKIQKSNKVTLITTTYTTAVPPYQNLLSEDKTMTIFLFFYDNILYQIGCQFDYKVKQDTTEFSDIVYAFARNFITKYGDLKGAKTAIIDSLGNTGLGIFVDGIMIAFSVQEKLPGSILVSYFIKAYSEKAQKDISEYEKEEKNIKGQMEGF